MSRDMEFDARTMRWWIAIERCEITKYAGVDGKPTEMRADAIDGALRELAEKAHGRLRDARKRRLKNMNRRWRHYQPRRILA